MRKEKEQIEEIRKLLFKLMCLFLKSLEVLRVASSPKDEGKMEVVKTFALFLAC